MRNRQEHFYNGATNPYECFCGEQFAFLPDLGIHLDRHGSRLDFPCVHGCDRRFEADYQAEEDCDCPAAIESRRAWEEDTEGDRRFDEWMSR